MKRRRGSRSRSPARRKQPGEEAGCKGSGRIESFRPGYGSAAPSSVVALVRDVFLPVGYPASVSDDYLEYQTFDTLQAFSSSLVGAFAVHATFRSLGVGEATATATAAALVVFLRNMSGMVSGIVFAYFKGHRLDEECKRMRLVADLLNDCALLLELLAPLFPLYLTTAILCTSNVCRAVVGVAGAATRASMTQHQARADNLGDVSAKDGSQETLVNLAAMLASFYILPMFADSFFAVWTFVSVFLVLHIFFNYRCVRCVRMSTFNRQRAFLAIRAFVQSRGATVLTPEEVRQQETVFYVFTPPYPARIRLGVALSNASSSRPPHPSDTFVVVHPTDPTPHAPIDVSLHALACPRDILHAYYTAVLLTLSAPSDASLSFDRFCACAIESGWSLTERLLLDDQLWRFRVKDEPTV